MDPMLMPMDGMGMETIDKNVNVMGAPTAPKDAEVDETKFKTPTGGEI